MGTLRHLASGEQYFLLPRHSIGRAPTCELCVCDSGVSGFHAELIWDGEHWYVQDLGSRNGTTLGERSLAKGEQVRLEQGAELALAKSVRFQLVDDSAPHLIASSDGGEVRVATDELLCLPSDEAPELTLYRDIDGCWLVEAELETRALEAVETLIAGERAWRVVSPRFLPRTRELDSQPGLRYHTLCFEVSRDGEHVSLSLARDSEGPRTSLEDRAHQMLLLELARERLRDQQNAELPESERGWLYRDELPDRLGVQPPLIHLWIHRARRQLARAGIRDAASLIERRRGSTQLRLGTARLTIKDN